MFKKLALLAALACGAVSAQNTVSLDPSQIYNTVNIVNNTTSPTNTTGTWQNIGLWGQGLPCWAPGGPVYCGPQPYFNSGSFNFSYGMTDVYQTANIANSLPSSGAGLRVNGYDFSFMAKNGNGWDDGRQDYLIAYTVFRDAAGAEKYSKTYDLNKNIGYWANYSFSETFATPFATRDLGTVQYGFVGMDNNFWAGPYGPEVTNVSFSLKYSVDPCATNPLYSPTCPGYLDALNKLITTSTASTSTATTTTTTTDTAALPPPPPPGSPPPPPGSQPPPGSPPPPPGAGPSPQTATAATTAKSTESSAGTGLGLSVIAKNQQREQSIVSAVVQTATSSAESAAATSMQESLSVAATAVSNSQAFAVSIGSIAISGTGIRASSTASNMGFSGAATQEFGAGAGSVINASNMLLDRTNPINEYIEFRPAMPPGPAFSGPTVNRSAANNEAAGGVDINKIALAPTGYNDYLNLIIRDAAFYAPREVYKNQRTVDNARALRQMTNDSRHREMVEGQYR